MLVRASHNDAEIRGSFTGLAAKTTRENLTSAVLEGVAFGLRDSFEALVATDANLDQLIAIGGETASRYWLRLIAVVMVCLSICSVVANSARREVWIPLWFSGYFSASIESFGFSAVFREYGLVRRPNLEGALNVGLPI